MVLLRDFTVAFREPCFLLAHDFHQAFSLTIGHLKNDVIVDIHSRYLQDIFELLSIALIIHFTQS